MMHATPARVLPQQSTRDTQRDVPQWDATDLTNAGGQALILLGDQTYTLRITRAGKLILTK